MGSLGVCVERTTILQQPPSVDFPTIRASQQPTPAPFSYAKAFRLSPSLSRFSANSFLLTLSRPYHPSSLSAAGGTLGIYILII